MEPWPRRAGPGHYAGLAAATPDGEPEERGEGQASLMFDGQRWWVVSKTW
ncbi:hypothetical protein [Kutzneria sp. NPDC051319]